MGVGRHLVLAFVSSITYGLVSFQIERKSRFPMIKAFVSWFSQNWSMVHLRFSVFLMLTDIAHGTECPIGFLSLPSHQLHVVHWLDFSVTGKPKTSFTVFSKISGTVKYQSM